MADLSERLEANREAVEELVGAAGRSGPSWAEPRAPGKWSPSQVVEHVALTLEEGAKVIADRPSKLPSVPYLLRPVARFLLFRRVLRKGAFPKARTNQEMNPDSGPATPEEGARRLTRACDRFESECRSAAELGERIETPFFGRIPLLGYIRFVELHTLHHLAQMPGADPDPGRSD